MHHELYFALLGHTGDVVQARDDGFFVRADISFLTQPQRVMIDRLLQLGHAFAVLDRFVTSARRLPSLYVRGLAQGVEAVLHEYTDAIVGLEAKILTTHVVFPIPQMVYELEEFAELLPELLKLVLLIQSGPSHSLIRGGALLRIVHGLTESGFPRLRKRMVDLQRCCHSILFKQITSWMAYGDIVDPYDEFFVRKLQTEDPDTPSFHDDTGAGFVESQIWQTRYALEPANAPPYFSSQVIESIFFIGKSVQILARSKGFSSEEAYRLIQTFGKVQSAHEFQRVVLEHAVEDIRAQIASRLYQEIVVKADFVDHLKLLKNMFLMGRGEIFQSLLDQTSSSLMATKPNHKSEDELHHGVWSQILRDFQVDENPLIRHFHLELPLQTFRFPPFPDASGLVLVNMAAQSRSLHVKDRTQSCGGAWWPHRQVEHLPFTSTIVVDLSPAINDALLTWRGGKVALLYTKDASLPAFHVPASGASVALSGVTVPGLVSFELDLQPIGSETGGLAAVARVVRHAADSDEETHASSPLAVPLDNNTLAFHVQYSRVEVRDEATGKVASPRMATIIVNGHKILEFECDLTPILGSGTLTNDHYAGLCVTPYMRIAEWRLDKYPSRSYVQPGKLLSESHETLSAREQWNYLTMRCDLRWPMHLLVSKSLLRSYGHLFQFSLRLKRVVHALEHTWKYRIFRPNRKKNETDSPVVRAATTLRGRMSFVVRNIEQYFQLFVVESSFLKCLEEIEAAQDLDKVKRIHEQFVAQLVRRFYLHTHSMQGAIDQVLRCCWEFAEYASYQESLGDAVGRLLPERVAALDAQFADKFGLLFRTLRHPNMRDLLVLLDYNAFFSHLHPDPHESDAVGTSGVASSVSSSSALLRGTSAEFPVTGAVGRTSLSLTTSCQRQPIFSEI